MVKRTVNLYALGAEKSSIKSDNYFEKTFRDKKLRETTETLPCEIYIQNKKD